MFEWLDSEIATIRTPRFHIVDGHANKEMREAVQRCDFILPAGYKEFILRFGNAKLYHIARSDAYKVGVFAAPRKGVSRDIELYHLGFHDGAAVYTKEAATAGGACVFEFEDGDEEKVAESFTEWLEASCAAARRSYGPLIWAKILRGPEPFTPEEQDVIRARRNMEWHLTGIDAEGNHVFSVTNHGNRTLPGLTIGVRSRDGRLNGAIRLKVDHVGAGATTVVRAACYKGLIAPQELETFSLPDPRPEEREFYYEFESPLRPQSLPRSA